MTRALIGVGMTALLSAVAFGQSADSKRAFALADVHVSPRSTTPVMRVSSRAGRYEIRNATMVDLIRTAYTVDADSVQGGPNWLEYDRFDIVALVPPKVALACHNITMETFAADLKRLTNGYVTNAVVDQTGLKGSWDFGLKLEEHDIPTPVVVVEQATANSPDVAAKLPPRPPIEFEVADIKPVDPNVRQNGPGQIGVLPGGRVNLPGIPLKLLIMIAWNIPQIQNEPISGAPKWIDSASFTIIGKLPADLAPANATGGVPARAINCQNITMAQFADQLQMFAGPYFSHPVVDATSLDGAWDFTLSYSPIPPAQLAGLINGARVALPPGAAGAGDSSASDPIGGAMSLFDAVEKQLGLKLDMQKRTYPVFVIDHIEEKPTDN